jgi:hypothetical protein
VPRRTLAWLLTLPLVAAGVLGAHALGYALTGTPSGPAHEYLRHGPQIALALVAVGLLGVAVEQRGSTTSRAPFALVAPVAFTAMEIGERLGHGADIVVLTEPSFLAGLALQVPVALACLELARVLVSAVRSPWRERPAFVAELTVAVVAAPAARRSPWFVVVAHGRGPPFLQG